MRQAFLSFDLMVRRPVHFARVLLLQFEVRCRHPCVCRLRVGEACKALHRLVRRASPLWEVARFSGDLGHEDTALKAEQFMAWLLRKAPAVKGLQVTLKVDEGAEVDTEQEAR